jgi:hypothetical protein
LGRTLCIVMSDDFEFGSNIMYCDVWLTFEFGSDIMDCDVQWLWVWVGHYVLWCLMTLSLGWTLCIVMSDDYESDIMYCDVWWLWVWVGHYVLWCPMTMSRTLCIVMSDDFESDIMYCEIRGYPMTLSSVWLGNKYECRHKKPRTCRLHISSSLFIHYSDSSFNIRASCPGVGCILIYLGQS